MGQLASVERSLEGSWRMRSWVRNFVFSFSSSFIFSSRWSSQICRDPSVPAMKTSALLWLVWAERRIPLERRETGLGTALITTCCWPRNLNTFVAVAVCPTGCRAHSLISKIFGNVFVGILGNSLGGLGGLRMLTEA